MSGVDDRIVSMKFDNAAFERNLSDTLKSLDKLKHSLNFANSTRGMNELSSASKNVNLAPMGAGVDGISAKFLALTTVAVTALATIVSHAITAGARMVKALSFDPIKEGFKEYETNMNSIQTILANTDAKGTTLEDVTAALDKLNTYSDQTIYNFSQMAKNIGTFTAAGVDLDTSVNSIKGIANLAAISGSNAEQASTAMYQLSQAMASGTVKLMDWNSVVNAGMGGEVFQKALFEAGKAAKTLKDVPLDQTFDEWKKAGNSFRGSLEQGWITGEVLTNTLSGFTGDLTEAQIMSMGYTKEQAAEVMRLGKIGKAAATEVKTLTQLISTVKESVASGWSSSFRLIIGDFNEAKTLFTNISNGIGGIISKSSDARNEMLKGWKELGGRDVLINAFENALASLGSVLGPIVKGFRDIFPPMTAKRLFDLTVKFDNFMARLRVSLETSDKIRRTFAGVFAVLEIGWTIFKGILGLIGDVIGALSGAGSGLLGFTGSIGDMLVGLNKALVDGGGIAAFFDNLGEVIKKPIEFISLLIAAIGAFFQGLFGSKKAEQGLGELEDRMGSLSKVSDRFGGALKTVSDRFENFGDVFGGVWTHIKTWFSELGSKLANAFKPGDFDAAVDIVNVGLIGGILLVLRKFVKNGLKLDIGGGIFEKMGGALDAFTGKMQAMTTNVKSDTLMKIAIAVGILTASILILSMIDSGKLTIALTAMTVGFGQLIGVMTLLTNITQGPMGAVKVGILAASMILLAGAMVVLSVAIKILSSLSWNELAKGLVGLAVGLGLMIAAMHLLPPSPGMIASAIAMGLMAGAMFLLSKAVKSFAELSWGEMAKGLIGVAAGLGVIIVGMSFMPPHMVVMGLGLIAVAVGLRILANAVQAFADMSWGELVKGLIGIGAALVIVAGAMWLFPPHMILVAAGILIFSLALKSMAKAVEILGNMKLGDVVKGLGALAVMLGIMAAAMIVMTGTLAGAAALIVAAGALSILAGVLKTLGGMSIGEIVKGLVALAGVFLVLGVAALVLGPIVPILLTLGWALALIGGAMMLFGVGAYLVAKAFEAMAKAGRAGVAVLLNVIEMLVTALPKLVQAFVRALVELASELLAAAPLLVRLATALLVQILDTVIDVVPKIAEALSAFVTAALILIRAKFPELLVAGFELLMALLRGIRDNIQEITMLGVEIVVNLAKALIENAVRIVAAGVELLMTFLGAIANRATDIVAAGLNLVLAFIRGIIENVSKIVQAAGQIIIKFIEGINNGVSEIINAGINAILWFLEGISSNIVKVTQAAVGIVLAFIKGVSEQTLLLVETAANLVIDFLNGLANIIEEKAPEFRKAGGRVVKAIVDGMVDGLKDTPVVGHAIKLAEGIVGGVKGVFESKSPSKVFMRIAKTLVQGLAIVFDSDTTAKRSAIEHSESIIKAFQDSLNKIPNSIAGMGEFTPVITPVLDLTKVQMASRDLDRLMSVSPISPEVSYSQARLISTTTDLESAINAEPVYSGPAEVTFEQNIYAPTALSTNDIYRNTKSQIVLAKEELGIS